MSERAQHAKIEQLSELPESIMIAVVQYQDTGTVHVWPQHFGEDDPGAMGARIRRPSEHQKKDPGWKHPPYAILKIDLSQVEWTHSS